MRATHVFAAFFAMAALTLAASEPVKDPDLFWHLASGQWMLDNGRLLDRDVVRSTAGVAVRARELGWRESASGAGFVLFEVP